VVFFLFGAMLLPGALEGIGWRHVLYAFLSLTVLRMAPAALVLMGLGLRPSTLAFLGWFGPRGIASIIYLLLLYAEYPFEGLEVVGDVILLTVALSILLHGATAAPLARAYGARMKKAGPSDAGPEHRHVEAIPLGRHAREVTIGNTGKRDAPSLGKSP
jgi:NhaP-type Na+/H+ or K+/H+ antiporter